MPRTICVHLCKSVAKNFRAGGIRTHDLLNPIQAFYQAELRPDSSRTLSINQKSREATADDSWCDLSPRRPFYQVRHGESVLWRTELRPETVEEHCLFVKNHENQLTVILRNDLSPRRRFTKFATANSSCGGLNYGPIEAPNMRKLGRLATNEHGFSHLEIIHFRKSAT